MAGGANAVNNRALANILFNQETEPCLELEGNGARFDISRSAFIFFNGDTPIDVSIGFQKYAQQIAIANGQDAIVSNNIPLVIPGGTKTLVIISPTPRDTTFPSYSDDEINAIYCFIQSGGRLIFINDADNISNGANTEVNRILTLLQADASFTGDTLSDDQDGFVEIEGNPFVIDLCIGRGGSVTGGTTIATYESGETVIAGTNVGAAGEVDARYTTCPPPTMAPTME